MSCNITLLLMENTLMKIVHLAILMYAKNKQTNQSWLRTPGAVVVWRAHPGMSGMIYRRYTANFLINDSAISWSFSKRKKKMCWWTYWARGGTPELHLLAGASEIFWHYKEYAGCTASTECANGCDIGGVGNVVMVCMCGGGSVGVGSGGSSHCHGNHK